MTNSCKDSLISSIAPMSANVTPISFAGITSGLIRFSNSLSGGISCQSKGNIKRMKEGDRTGKVPANSDHVN